MTALVIKPTLLTAFPMQGLENQDLKSGYFQHLAEKKSR